MEEQKIENCNAAKQDDIRYTQSSLNFTVVLCFFYYRLMLVDSICWKHFCGLSLILL